MDSEKPPFDPTTPWDFPMPAPALLDPVLAMKNELVRLYTESAAESKARHQETIELTTKIVDALNRLVDAVIISRPIL